MSIELFLGLWLWIALGMMILWFFQYKTVQADCVDVGWALGLVMAAMWFGYNGEAIIGKRLLLVFCVSIWGGRLALHLFLDRVLSSEEDGRYSSLRNHWGSKAQLKFFLFFQFQGLLVLVLSIPFFIVANHPAKTLGVGDLLALVVFTVSIVGEAIADKQLLQFKRDKSRTSRVCRVGLWQYSRHPNYFFEWLGWWTYVLLAIGSPWWWVSVISPLLMLIFILKLTGIPPIERRALKSKGQEYVAYQNTTNAFFPWFRKEVR